MINIFLKPFRSKVIKFFSVTPSTYQSQYSMLITGSYKHSAIPELSHNTKCQDALVQYTQGYNGQRSDVLELMININMEWSRAYAQHCQLYFHVFQRFMLNTKHLIDHVLEVPCPTQNIYIHISSTIGLRPIYKSNHHVHIQWGI